MIHFNFSFEILTFLLIHLAISRKGEKAKLEDSKMTCWKLIENES